MSLQAPMAVYSPGGFVGEAISLVEHEIASGQNPPLAMMYKAQMRLH
jgi:hypothetical protein